MGTERRHCRSRNIGIGEGKEGVLLSIVVSSVSLFFVEPKMVEGVSFV